VGCRKRKRYLLHRLTLNLYSTGPLNMSTVTLPIQSNNLDLLPWVAFNDTWDNFQVNELNNPGTLIECFDQRKGAAYKEIFLIGHINPLGGVCDCCTDMRYEKIIVTRYVILYKD
jgi:hypothetical protein